VPLPCVPLNDNAVADNDSAGAGVGGTTVKVAVIVAGDPCAPVAVTVICPVYVPAASVPRVAETWSACGAVPLAGLTESHEASLVVVYVRVPLPVFVRFTAAAGGFVPLPCVALNETEVWEIESTEPAVAELP
jgi:hypothetical protein